VVLAVALRNMMLDAHGNIQLCDFGLSLVTHTGKDGSQYGRLDSSKDVPYEMYVQICVRFDVR
jgi:hypothetical protein